MSEKKLIKKQYEKKMQELQIELVKLQDWVIDKGKKIAIIFEGRDAAGKGGVIKRIAEHLNPRYCKSYSSQNTNTRRNNAPNTKRNASNNKRN